MEKKRKENAEKTQKKKREEEYEYCKICRLNHNQGRRHNFFPRHTTSLSSLLSRFLHKLSLLHSSLSNPTFFLPQHASSSSPFWCIFCDFDFDDFGSSFACGNVIKHLASDDHLKNVKHFLWKYGGGMNKVDSFRVTEAEFAKWEKKCEVLKCKATSPSGIHHGTLHGELNDIRPNYDVLNNFEKNNIPFLEPNLLNNVLPLQYNTNENYQVCRLDISEAGKAGPSYEDPGLQMAQGSEHGLNTWSSTYIDYGSTYPLPSCPVNLLADGLIHKAVSLSIEFYALSFCPTLCSYYALSSYRICFFHDGVYHLQNHLALSSFLCLVSCLPTNPPSPKENRNKKKYAMFLIGSLGEDTEQHLKYLLDFISVDSCLCL
ncbi:hypothetical protein RND81_13G095400 [Saponaria officinalis]|uniref:Uncharacterized protein n=1 Tax=Saponaria officinalis TaxID=3572 RepID=A0AAW1GYX6_SAPOF